MKIVRMVEKEFRSLARDKTSLFFTIAVPVLILLAFGVSFTEYDPVLAVELDIAISNQDPGPYGELFTEYIRNSTFVKVNEELPTTVEARELVKEGRIAGAVIIPSDFSDALNSNTTAFILIIADDTKHGVAETLEAKIAEIGSDFAEKEIAAGEVGFLSINEESITGRDLPTRAAAAPQVMGLALVFSCFDDVAGAVARERSKGTLTRLFLTRISRWELFAGKTLSSILLTIIRTAILIVIIKLYFNVKVAGNIFLVFLIAALVAVNTIGIGLVLSVRSISERAVVIANFALMVPLIFLTGVLQPIDLFPESTRQAVKFIPFVWTNDALRRVIHLGQGFSSITFNIGYTCLTAALLYVVAAIAWKGRID